MTPPLGAACLVLMYHRVAAPATDPWKLCVSPARLAEHLDVLRAHAEVVPLSGLVEAADALGTGAAARPTVALTFDDGYVDNLLVAKPLLETSGLPATVFVATGYLGGERQFWWDELAGLLLAPRTLPPSLTLVIGGVTYHWTLGDAAGYSEADAERDRAWRALETPPTARHALFVELWGLLKPASRPRQQYLLNVLRGWAATPLVGQPPDRAVTPAELRALAAGGLIDIGAHTVTHPILEGLPAPVQLAEMRESKARLEELLDRPIDSFAYPYGAAGPDTVQLVADAGFRCACTTMAGTVRRAADPFRLPRFTVEDWDGGEFLRQLSRWSHE